MNLLQQFETEQIAKLSELKTVPQFKYGDTVKVTYRISSEEDTGGERMQMYEGVCIARRSRGVRSSFKLRKMSSGVGVERNFKTYSPNVVAVEVVKRGVVRRAKLYYMRKLTGKAARIREVSRAAKPKS